MKPSTAFRPTHSLALLLVGEPKTGKTNLVFAFPKPGIIDIDLNLASAIRRAPNKVFSYDQPTLTDAGVARPTHEVWPKILDAVGACVKDPNVETIVIDGLGLMTNLLCDYIVHTSKAAGTNKSGKMEIQNYGDLGNLLRNFVMALRASGKNIVVTSHQSADKDELTGALRYTLAIPGQCKETLGGLFTDVWATTATPAGMGKVKFEIRTRPTGFHVALGTSFGMDSLTDVTDKTPDQIWSLIQPKLVMGGAK